MKRLCEFKAGDKVRLWEKSSDGTRYKEICVRIVCGQMTGDNRHLMQVKNPVSDMVMPYHVNTMATLY